MPYAMQPIEDVKEYFGEKIALYFAFIGQVGAFDEGPLLHSLRLSFPLFCGPLCPA
jgi:hypothetical protein